MGNGRGGVHPHPKQPKPGKELHPAQLSHGERHVFEIGEDME